MHRSLQLSLLLITAATGLGWLAYRTVPSGLDRSSGEPAQQPPLLSEDADPHPAGGKVELGDPRPTLVLPKGPEAEGTWEVVPMNERGQPLRSARLLARKGQELLSGTGRQTWLGVTPGDWELKVEADGLPPWTSTIAVQPGSLPLRTAVHLGDAVRIKGTVLDTRGRPVARTPISLLPSGTSYSKAGTVTARTDSSGRFDAELPAAGNYRVALGAPERARWTEKAPGSKLWNGGPSTVEVTAPPLAYLSLEFKGDGDDRPTELEVFSFHPEKAALLRAAEAEQKLREEEQRQRRIEGELAAKRKLLKREPSGRAPASTEGSKRPAPRSRPTVKTPAKTRPTSGAARSSVDPLLDPLLGPGWERIRTVPVTAQSMTLEPLPHGVPLKLAFRRRGLRHATAAPLLLTAARDHLGQVRLPTRLPKPRTEGTTEAIVTVAIEPVDETEQSPPGVLWR